MVVNLGGLPKHIKQPLLKIPAFPGNKLMKVSRFVDAVLSSNASEPHLHTVENLRVCAAFFSYKCQPKHYQCFMRDFRKAEYLINTRCSESRQEAEGKRKTHESEQGVLDKDLTWPGFKKIDYAKITYD